MKYFSTYLVMTLMLFGSIKVMAQSDCPNIEWMRFFNNENRYHCIISKVDTEKNAYVTSRYEGAPSFGSFNIPAAASAKINAFIGKVDSTGNPLWVEVAENYTYGNDFFYFSTPLADSAGDLYTTLRFVYKTKFNGTTYTGNTQKNNTLLIKFTTQGQVLAVHLFDGINFVLRGIDKSSNLYCSTDFEGTISIDNNSYVSDGGTDILVFKLNQQLGLQWAQQIGGVNDEFNTWTNAFKLDSIGNVFMAGAFRSPVISIGNTQLNNPYAIPNNLSSVFLTKIDNNGLMSWVKEVKSPNLSLSALAIDNDENVYISGNLVDSMTLSNNLIYSIPSNKSNSILIKYEHGLDSFSSLIFSGGENHTRDLLFLPNKNMLILSGGIVNNDTVDFGIGSVTGNNSDFYVVALGLSNLAEQRLLPQWVVHSKGDGYEFDPVLAKDFNDNIYLSGWYSDDFGTGVLDHYTFPSIPGNANYTENGYQAKLSVLSREVTDSNGLLSAVQDSAVYQWLDCDNAMQPVAGATQQSFQPTQPGSYAVRVSNSFCSVVSECISTTGISESQRLRQIEVYPNPVREMLHLSHLPLGTEVSVFDVLGRAVYTTTATKANLNISTRLWSPGLYMLRLSKDGAAHLEKVLKE